VRPEENLPVSQEPFRPQDLAETVRNTFLLMAGTRGITLRLDLSAEAAQERVSDRVRVNQALSNLVKNAILHSGARTVTLSYAEEQGPDGRECVWAVTDNGRGIDAADRPSLFLPFSRITDPERTRADGSGLGLFVTRTAAELLGGTVTYESPQQGGSRFVLRLPAPDLPVADIAPPKDAAPAALVAPLRVLVVEDSDLIGELLVARLNRIVAEVTWVRSGSEGLIAHDRMKPDVVLTDLFMPEMGGDEMTSTLRATGATCPIIGMTAAAIGDERSRFEVAGTDFVLTKPVSTAELIEALARVTPVGSAVGSAVSST
jgi:two-component system, sensor histidine kinase